MARAGAVSAPSSNPSSSWDKGAFFFALVLILLLPSSTKRTILVNQPYTAVVQNFSKMASASGVAVAELVFTIIAVIFAVPFLLVAFGFFRNSGFAQRVHPSDPNTEILEDIRDESRLQTEESRLQTIESRRQTIELQAIRKHLEKLDENSELQTKWSELRTNAIIDIGEQLKEKVD
jgi:hypothetical protein